MTPEAVSGILPVHNEASVLREVLEAIRPQRSELTELVVVLDDCTDRSDAIAQDYADVLVRVAVRNTARAIAAGIERSHHDLLVLLDGNTLVPSDFVQSLVQAWSRTHADVLEWHGGLMLLPRKTLRDYGPLSPRYLWTLELFLRVASMGGSVVKLDGPFRRLKPSPLGRSLRYGLDYADLSDRYGLPPFFRIGTKSGLLPDLFAAAGLLAGHLVHGHLRSALRRTPSMFSRL